MNIKEYIQGKRHGKNANQVEREAMNDPFLQDAIDGFDTVEGNHHAIIEQLEKRINQKVQEKKRYHLDWKTATIAASITILLSVGCWIYFYSSMPESTTLAMDSKKEIPLQETTTAMEEPEAPPPPVRSTIQFTPPVIADASEISDYSEMKVAEEAKAEYETKQEDAIVDVAPSKVVAKEREAVAPAANAADKKVIARERLADTKDKSMQVQEGSLEVFGEKEFKVYFERKHTKGICKEKEAFIELHFYIDAAGTPKNIVIEKTNCTELQKEVLKLLEESPKWTKTQQTIHLEFKNVQ